MSLTSFPIPTNSFQTYKFLSTGGTAARSASDRAADIRCVKDFGAVGNGVADDTAAIQSAINSAGGNWVFFPAGVYRITTPLTFISQTWLQGTGVNSNIRMDDPTGVLDHLQVFNTTNGRIKDFLFTRAQAASAGSAIHIRDSEGCLVYSCNISDNHIWNGITVEGAATSSTNKNRIQNNNISNCLNDGIFITGASTAHAPVDTLIENRNYINNCGNAGVHFLNYGSGLFIVDNTLFANKYGLYLDIGTGLQNTDLSSCTIRGNDIDSNVTYAIYAKGLSSTILHSNHQFGSPSLFILCDNISANGSLFEGSGASLTLQGCNGWADVGSLFSGMTAPVTIDKSGATDSANISITGAMYQSGNGFFATAANATAVVPTLSCTLNALAAGIETGFGSYNHY